MNKLHQMFKYAKHDGKVGIIPKELICKERQVSS